jgi:hypothetical protein
MPIPAGTKFHGVAPGVETDNRGSKTRNSERNVYTIEDFGGGPASFKAVAERTINSLSYLAYVRDYDEEQKLPIARWNFAQIAHNLAPKLSGLIVSSVAGEVIDVVTAGEVDDVLYIAPAGQVVEVGTILYAGISGYLAVNGSPFFDESISVGRILSPSVFVSNSGTYDIVKSKVYVTLPNNTAYFYDGISKDDSIRWSYVSSSDVITDYNIVKSSATQNISLERWDPANGDTVDQILGVTTKGYFRFASDSISVCLEGIIRIPRDQIGGTVLANAGVPIYSDATTPYLLTTDPTSGVKIGFVIHAIQTLPPDSEAVSDIQIIPDKSSSAITRLIPFFQEATPGGSGTYTENNNIVDFNWVGGPGIYEFTLPSATTIPYRTIRFVNDATVTANDKVHIVPPAGETIDGGAFYAINKPYNGCMVWSDGTEWIVIQAKST